jgi:ADP-heptose:LPS heptosyltransferase
MLDTPTLHDYCDVIHSCKHFVAMTSGGATLAAALGKGCTALFGQGQATMFHHSPICRYVKI